MGDQRPLEVIPGGAGPDVIRDQDKVMLVLAYLGLLSLIPLLTVKDSDYVKWHARQGLALLGCWIAWSAAITILSMIPLLGLVFAVLGMLGHVGLMALMIVGIVKAFGPERWRIPIASTIAEKIPF